MATLQWYYNWFTTTAGEFIADAPIYAADDVLTDTDMDQLLTAHIARRVPVATKGGGGLILFTVEELPKRRRRLIRWTKQVNERGGKIPHEHSVPLLTVREATDAVATHSFAVCIDIEGQFDAIVTPIGEADAPLHVFSYKAQKYAMSTIPTGQRQSSSLAQLITQWLAQPAVRLGFRVDTYVDNIRILVRDEQLDTLPAAIDAVYNRALTVQLQFDIPRSEAVPLQRYDFLGVRYDHVARTVDLTDRARAKLTEAATDIAACDIPYRRLQECVGTFQHAERVLHTEVMPLQRYWIYKQIRRLARPDPYTRTPRLAAELVHIWPSARAAWTNWITSLMRAPPRHVESRGRPTAVLIADASESGWAAWFWDDHEPPRVVASEWPAWLVHMQPLISELEILALALGLAMLTIRRRTVLTLVSDNTTALAGVRRGHLRNYFDSRALQLLLGILKEKNLRVASSYYIRSAHNPADFFSRLAEYLKRHRTPDGTAIQALQ